MRSGSSMGPSIISPPSGSGRSSTKKRDMVLCGSFHAIAHGGDEGIEAHAGVLDVEYERVDSLQHLIRGAFRVAIETVDRQAGRGSVALATVASALPAMPCSGLKQRDELHAVGMRENVNRAPPLRVHARLIGDQADALASQRREILLLRARQFRFGVCCAGLLRADCCAILVARHTSAIQSIQQRK